VATCAVGGAFVHLYTALEANLFQPYGMTVEHTFIGGTAASLGALGANDIHFLYCGADGTLPGLSVGSQGKLVIATVKNLGYVLVTRPDVRSVTDLKGKSVGVARVGDLPDRLLRVLFERHGLVPNEDVMIRAIGGSGPERHRAMIADVIQGHLIGPPFDAAARKDGYNVVYEISDLGLPSAPVAVHASNAVLRDNPRLVQRFVAAMAESVRFAEQNPAVAREALRKTMDLDDPDGLDSVYNSFAVKHANRSMLVSFEALRAGIEEVRTEGTPVTIDGPDDIATNAFVEDLQRTGFFERLWGGQSGPSWVYVTAMHARAQRSGAAAARARARGRARPVTDRSREGARCDRVARRRTQ